MAQGISHVGRQAVSSGFFQETKHCSYFDVFFIPQCPPLHDYGLSSTDVVVCQVEIPRQEGKSGKSVNRRTEAERSQSVFARVRWRIEGSCAVGWSYSWKTSGEALTPVSRLGVAALYPETARMSRATRTQLSAEVKPDGGRAMVLEP
jgi:hypothetical protein